MKSKTEKRKVKDSREIFSGSSLCFSVISEALKTLQKGQFGLEFFGKDSQHKSYQGKRNYFEMFGFVEFSDLRNNENYGACAIAVGSPNSTKSFVVTLSAIMPLNILTGLRALSKAVLMVFMAIATFFLALAAMQAKEMK